MEHGLFKPKTLEEGKHAVVGDCNGVSMSDRYDIETSIFARAITTKTLYHGNIVEPFHVLDYGCGVGRLIKGLLEFTKPNVPEKGLPSKTFYFGVDASEEMLAVARNNVQATNTMFFPVWNIPQIIKSGSIDLAYCIYVLQHVPAVEIRSVLSRIYQSLKDDGIFIYCSSDYRMAIRHDQPGFFDDRFLGVDLQDEISRYFEPVAPLFSQEEIAKNQILDAMINGKDGGLKHPATVYRKKLGILLSFAMSDSERTALESKKKSVSTMKDVKVERICSIPDDVAAMFANIAANTQPQQEHALARKICVKNDDVIASQLPKSPKKLLLINRLAPGDCLVMTNALRDLHLMYPGEYITEVNCPAMDIFTNNPYRTSFFDLLRPLMSWAELAATVSKFSKTDPSLMDIGHRTIELANDVLAIDMHYPLIHESGVRGVHFSQGHTDWLSKVLGRPIKQTSLVPEIYLTNDETNRENLPFVLPDKYWVINAGSKTDFTLKQYPFYQEVVDSLHHNEGRGSFPEIVQIGQKEHIHKPLNNTIDLVGKTSLRDLFKLIYHAEGVITCVSLPMHVAAALRKPCVVVAGAREGTRWELYPNHQFLYVNGCLPCASYDGCWLSKNEDCNNKINKVPKCMTLIEPFDVMRAVMRYYDGGML